MASDTNKIISLASRYSVNPSIVQHDTLDVVQAAFEGGMDIVDATNPFITLLTASATQAAACMTQSVLLDRRRYKKLAATKTDLYPHLADEDLVGLFVTPNRTTVTFGISTSDVNSLAVTDSVNNIRKLVIPRDTVYSVDGLDFYAHYPINIVVLNNGGYHCYLDQSYVTPLGSSLGSNVLKQQIVNLDGRNMLLLTIPVEQLSVIEQSWPIIQTTGFNSNITFSDQFHYVRAFMSDDNIGWTELSVTYSDQVYDSANPTIVVTVDDGYYNARIPLIYFTNGTVKATLKLLTFTSKGVYEQDLSDFDTSDWAWKFRDFNTLSTLYSAPLAEAEAMLVLSSDYLDGGANEVSFDTMRKRALYSRYGKNVAVTDDELEVDLDKLGYGYTRQKETATGNIYVANKSMPLPAVSDNRITSAIGVSNAKVEINTTRTDLSSSMIVNDQRTTIKPSALFKEVSGGTTLLADNQLAALHLMGENDLADEVNDNQYLYTPFHYVLDDSNSIFETRAYYLDEPSYVNRSYINSNIEVGFNIATNSATVKLDDVNYTLTIIADIPTGLVDPFIQVSFDVLGYGRVYQTVQGSNLSATQAEFIIVLETALDIDSNGNLYVNNMVTTAGVTESIPLPLLATLSVIYVAETTVTINSAFDSMLYVAPFDGLTYSAVGYEEITVRLGTYLEGLYSVSRAILSAAEYAKYETSKELLYDNNQFRYGANGRIYTINEDGSITLAYSAYRGDVQVDSDGNTIYEYEKGQYVHDQVTGELVTIKASGIVREVRFVLFDAKYLFTTVSDLMEYRDSIPGRIITWLTNDILPYSNLTIEGTTLYFEPISSSSTTLVNLNAGRDANLRTALSFDLELKLTKAGFNNTDLRTNLESSVKTALVEALSGRTFSLANAYALVKDVVGDEVIDFVISNPINGGQSATLPDTSSIFTLETELRPLANGLFDIVDSISFSYIKGEY